MLSLLSLVALMTRTQSDDALLATPEAVDDCRQGDLSTSEEILSLMQISRYVSSAELEPFVRANISPTPRAATLAVNHLATSLWTAELEEMPARHKQFQAALKSLVENEQQGRHRHPWWEFDLRELHEHFPSVMLCATILSLSGFLCSVAGVGGNIIQVSVLMVMGQLSPYDAVPLSKMVVLSGAVGAMIVHLRSGSATSGHLVNWDLCRLVLPACLLGTCVGVPINQRIDDLYIVLLLSIILFCISLWVFIQACVMHCQESKDALQEEQGEDSSAPRRCSTSPEVTASWFDCLGLPTEPVALENALTKWDMIMAFALLVIVVACGVVSDLTSDCHNAIFSETPWNSSLVCQHPLLRIIFFGRFQGLALQMGPHQLLQLACIILPICACLACGEYSVNSSLAEAKCISRTRLRTVQFFVFAMGLVGSLTGVGSGVALSPFFIMLGLRPHKAVATSLMCVIFISLSSALQYVMTDRVEMTLACIYSTVTILASCVGASSTLFVVQRLTRPSLIMAFIGASVLISFGISVHQGIHMLVIPPVTS
eukprot:TRINITY_DN9091_c0_g2_i2.p1 TRINITY_DN9091_c0_g2~~TRINITY_DN9091_c0_g2_i2.p1  ORF type:complete len:542 (+),score=87.17 TRINITY_DN9091_c0_g2_i2:131-1756(+)